MAISLRKGGNVSLKKAASASGSSAPLTNIDIHLSWEERITDGAAFDADASVFMLNAKGKVNTSDDFIFYNQLAHYSGSVIHQGDDRKGADGETIKVELGIVPQNIEKILFVVTIHDAEINNQNFGMISNAFIRVINSGDEKEIIRYDLTEDAGTETSMIFAELYRYNGEWKLRAVGQGYSGGLSALCAQYGVAVD